MSPNEIMIAEEIASILGIKVTTLYDNRWRQQSGCPLFHQGKRLFVYRNKFDEWYKQRLDYV